MTDSWVPENTSIEVDLNSLRDFADHIGKELSDFFDKNVTDGIRPMLTVRAAWGGGGLKEGSFFSAVHDRNRKAAGLMLADVHKGILALASAAASIAADYASGDALSSANVDDVNHAFNPLDGTKSLDSLTNTNNGGTTSTAADQGGANADSHDHGRDNPGDPSALDGPTNPDGSVTIDGGKPGQYVIPGDNEAMHDCVSPTPSASS